MGKFYSNYGEALEQDTVCKFELEYSFELPIPTISIPIPDIGLDLDIPTFYCPLD